ncbi:hypothetical protein HK096_001531 [Nowakowskiella sp. JEL0078]|nr:hypothetical protein HK096_001531 [Nowakowskiella sp. JEL0078]
MQKIDGEQTTNTSLLSQQNDERINLRSISRARASKWDNTVSGQHRKKLALRLERQDAEEEVKAVLDKQYHFEERERRRLAIEKARAAQYCDKDLVKALHSKVLLHQVLHERDLQVEHKRKLKSAEKERDREWAAEISKKMQEDKEANLKVAHEQRVKAYAQRLALAHQIKQREEIEDKEILVNVHL